MRRLTLTLLLATAASAQDRAFRPVTRKALVIGNAAYAGATALKHPTNDARAMETILRELGFAVTLRLDASRRQMDESVEAFTANLREGDQALVYFAGHGMQVRGENYLLPVDFQARSEADVKDRAYSASKLQAKLEATRARVRLLVFDACRKNPYGFPSGGEGGLAPMTVRGVGTAIVFASTEGRPTTENAASANGLFTRLLLSALRVPGREWQEVFKRVEKDVHAASRWEQLPVMYGQIGEPLVLRPWNTPATGRANGDAVTPAPASGGSLAQRAIHPKDGLAYVLIPAGEFMMGCSPSDDECNEGENPVQVRITKPFYLGETEVTQQAYLKVMGTNPSAFKGAGLPVESVSHSDAAKYCKAIDGRLPTEAEWEWSAQGGLHRTRHGLAEEIAWYDKNSGRQTNPVGSRRKNGYGLYDMFGNVWEWTSTWYAPALAGGTDPEGPPAGKEKVVRGGAWDLDSRYLRVSFRNWDVPADRTSSLGFRCVWK